MLRRISSFQPSWLLLQFPVIIFWGKSFLRKEFGKSSTDRERRRKESTFLYLKLIELKLVLGLDCFYKFAQAGVRNWDLFGFPFIFSLYCSALDHLATVHLMGCAC